METRRTRRADLPAGARGRRSSGITADVLRVVLDHGPVARSTVARVAGYSAASLTGVSTLLIDKGLLREAPEAAGPPGVGRPHVPLAIDTETTAVVGVHIAVHRFTVALLDLRGRVLVEHKHEHAGRDPEVVLGRIAVEVGRLLEEAGGRRVLGLGLATGGWVDAAAGVVVEHPMLGWYDVPVRERLADATGLPVAVDGHSRALVRAEQLFGRHVEQARSSILQLFVGNVVDIAFATAGSVQQGPRSAAGAVAHLKIDDSAEPCECGKVGCFQAAVSERTLVRRALAARIIDRPVFRDLIGAAEGGDPRAVALFEERAGLVGRAAALLLDLFDPDLLSVVEVGERVLPRCRELLLAEVESGSRAGVGAGQVVAGTSFPEHVLATAGGAVVLDRIYAAPVSVPGRLSRAS
ncbi:ROK family protein [Nocardioides humi]|uniref:ROK family transcriptional regulator n=1 Tax=Nocardioides humi TaxID=449461 RepID=A0ABN2AG51_9ACTN|nr:ROK family protein [Nocardioides humi]